VEYTVTASDTNGVVDSFEVDWDNNGTYDSKNDNGVFTHAWDTAQSGNRSVKIRVKDNDGIWGEATRQATVKLGRPVLTGATFGANIQWVNGNGGNEDTMFYVYAGGITTMQVDTTDSNGRCAVYYWDFYNNGGWNDTTTTSDPAAGGKKISWFGKDVHDGTGTLYKVIVHKMGDGGYDDPDENNPADIAHDFQAGSLYEAGTGFEFGYTFTPTGGSGAYHYQVISKDARGSTAYSIISAFSF
jgi:hypothetical protein